MITTTTFALLLAGTTLVMTGCLNTKQTSMENPNKLSPEEIAAGKFTPEVMWKMGRVGSSTLSPDGQQVAFCITYYNMEENQGTSHIYTMPAEGGEPVRLTNDVANESSPQWSADGSTLFFLSDKSGSTQIWSKKTGVKLSSQHSNVADGIEGYGIAPDQQHAFYVKRVAVKPVKSADVYSDMDKSQALIYDDLMARHWNYWDKGEYMHIFVADIKEGSLENDRDIMENEPWDAPMAPYFDMSEIAWNHAGTQLAYTCKKMTGTEYAVSTDSDIYIYDLASGTTKNICKSDRPSDPRLRIMPEMAGYDKYPVFSPDDSKIAFRSMRRPGNESDKDRLFVWNSNDGTMKDLTENFDYNAFNVVWKDDNQLFFIAPIKGTHQICTVKYDDPMVEQYTSGDFDINAFSLNGDRIIFERTTLKQGTELFSINGEAINQITFINREIYDHIPMGKVEKRMVKTTDGKEMLTWVVFPPDFDPSRKYPTLLYCQGGPQSVVSQFWSYRWNLQLMAAQGYIVVAPNRRGVPSFGQEWLDQISGDYSGQNIRDYLSAIDDVSREPWCDRDRLGCVGASYGGYSVFYLAGHHEGRFKAFISHCGIFDFDSMYGETEELWFVNNDYGGPYWDKTNTTAQRSYANSPHKSVQNWDTPILIFTGLNDFRIPYTQSLEAFTAARVQGIPARLVVFENEAHQVFKPQNSLVWNREFFGWLDKYLK